MNEIFSAQDECDKLRIIILILIFMVLFLLQTILIKDGEVVKSKMKGLTAGKY